MSQRFLDALHSGRVLLMDGAMGTELQKLGLQPGECAEMWNLTHPEHVRAVHQAYVDDGAAVLLTNTLQANRRTLARFSLADRFEGIWFRSRNNVYAVDGPSRFITAGNTVAFAFADIGPDVDSSSGKEAGAIDGLPHL